MTLPSLPEDYGEGQRQYDMARAALSAADSAWVPVCSAGTAVMFLVTHSALLAFPVGLLCGWVFMRPYKRRVKEASDLWHQERLASLEALPSLSQQE